MSNNGIFTVGSSGEFSFEYLFDGGWYQGELGVYSLEGMDAYPLGSTAYIQEAARRAQQNSGDEGYVVMTDRLEGAKYSTALPWERDFNYGEYKGVKTFEMSAGSQFGFILAQHTSLQELSNNPGIYNQRGKRPIFSIAEANPNYTGDAPQQFAALDVHGTFGFEATRVDIASDRDYNEVVFQLIGAEGEAPYYGSVRNPGKNFRLSPIGQQIRQESKVNVGEDGYLNVGDSGEVTIDFLYDGGWYKGEVGLFSLEDMPTYSDNPLGFIQEAASRAGSNSIQGYSLFQDATEGTRYDGDFPWENNFNEGEYKGERTYQLTPGGRYGIIFVPNNTLGETAINPTLDEGNGNRPYFSMRGANLLNSVQMIEHQTGQEDYTIIGMEDLNVFFGGDRDYNDFIFSIEGASFYAPGYEDEKDPQFVIDKPIANDDSGLTYKDTPIAFSISDLMGNDYDFDGATISFDSFDGSGTNGSLTQVDGQILYDPDGQFDSLQLGETATDSFTYTITNSNGKTASATVDITIKGFGENSGENNVGTLDSVHFLPPLYAQQDVKNHYLLLSTDQETPFEVVIQNADGANGVAGGLTETITISKDSPVTLDLSSGPFGNGTGTASLGVIGGNKVGQIDTKEGLILTGDLPFYANVRHKTKVQGLSLTSKGQLALGTEFRSGHLVTNTQHAWRKSHFISVMASEDNTVVNFPDLPEGVEFINGYPGQVTLDKYESYVVGVSIYDNQASEELANSLQGTLVTSSKPVAVTTGSWLGGTIGAGRDIGIDQIVPTELVGNKYILVKGEATSNANLLERPIIVATEDNTEVYLRGETIAFATLSAGETLVLDGDDYAGDALLIETSNPAYVYQMTSANDRTAPGLSLTLPVAENAGNQEILIPNIDLLGPGKLNIVARATASIQVNNGAISGGVPVVGDEDFLVYQIEGLTGDVTITSDESVIVTSTNGGGHIGSASYWSGLASELALDDAVSTESNVPIEIGVLGNDLTGSDFAPVGLPELPSNGTAVINEDNTITYTPDAGFVGTDSFVYRGINGSGKTDTATVTVSVDYNLIEGTAGDDTLTGTAASDRIVGSTGSDTITTGAGSDLLVLASATEGIDTVTDFSVGNDRIDLTAIFGASDPLSGGQVSFVQNGADVTMQYNNADLMVFEDSTVNELDNSANFVFQVFLDLFSKSIFQIF